MDEQLKQERLPVRVLDDHARPDAELVRGIGGDVRPLARPSGIAGRAHVLEAEGVSISGVVPAEAHHMRVYAILVDDGEVRGGSGRWWWWIVGESIDLVRERSEGGKKFCFHESAVTMPVWVVTEVTGVVVPSTTGVMLEAARTAANVGPA